MLNKVTLIGNLGKDPELRHFPNGDPVCNFSLATKETWKDKHTGEKKEATEWHNITMTQKLAEISAQYLRKGSKVYIEGSLKTRKYQAKDGTGDRYVTEIKAREMKMLDSKGSVGGYQQEQRPQQQRPQQQRQQPQANDFDEDFPF